MGRPINFYVAGTRREHRQPRRRPRRRRVLARRARRHDLRREDGLDAAGIAARVRWVTATPHGDESAAGESITRELYELLARTDCDNARRVQNLDVFLMPVRNPDGRDAVTRTTAWGFDPNRDFGTQNQQENGLFVPVMNHYPGVFFIDAHQQGGGVLLPAQRGSGPSRDHAVLARLHPGHDRAGAAARVQRPDATTTPNYNHTTCSRPSTATRSRRC